MNKWTVAVVLCLLAVNNAHGNEIKREAVGTVNQSKCTAITQKEGTAGALIGTSVGAGVGAVAGRMLFGKVFGTLVGGLAGGAAGGYTGAKMGQEHTYNCSMIVKIEGKDYLLDSQGTTMYNAGQTVNVVQLDTKEWKIK